MRLAKVCWLHVDMLPGQSRGHRARSGLDSTPAGTAMGHHRTNILASSWLNHVQSTILAIFNVIDV